MICLSKVAVDVGQMEGGDGKCRSRGVVSEDVEDVTFLSNKLDDLYQQHIN